VLALAARLPLLAGLPNSFTSGEGERLAQALALIAGQWPQLAAGGTTSNLSLYVESASLRLLGLDAAAARLPAALVGAGAAVAFFFLARILCRPLPALAVSLLFATEAGSLAVSRSAYGYAWAQLLALLAALAVARAITGVRSLRWWALAGALAGLALLESAGGRWLLLAVLLFLLLQVQRRTESELRPLLLGGALAATVGAVTCLAFTLPDPRGPAAGLLAVFGGMAGGGQAQPLPLRLVNLIRAAVLLDGAALVESPLLPPGRSFLPVVPGLLALAGLLLAWRRRGVTLAAFLCLIPLLASALFTPAAVDLADVAPAVPFAYLLAAAGLQWLLELPAARFGGGQVLLLAAVGLSALLNVGDYIRWQTDPKASQARQPALLAVEVPAWAQAQLSARQTGGVGISVDEWQRARGRFLPTPVPGPAPTAVRPTPAPAATLAMKMSLRLGQAGELVAPRAAAVLPNGDVVVADSAGKRVVRYSAQGDRLGELPGQFAEPFDLAVSPAGEVYVLDADAGQIFKFDAAGNAAGTVGRDLGVYKPRGLDLDGQGRLYVADTGRDRVLVLGPDGAVLRQIDKSATPFQQPTDVAVDGIGNLYVAVPMEGRLLKFDATGRYVGDWGLTVTNTIDAPHLAFTPDGVLAATDPGQRRVVLFASDGRSVGAVAPTGDGLLRLPVGVVADSQGNLYVVDKGDASVKKYGRAN
jgi:4-amino-4-deoxy-L-arabinose transferase-like glycosyltransferase